MNIYVICIFLNGRDLLFSFIYPFYSLIHFLYSSFSPHFYYHFPSFFMFFLSFFLILFSLRISAEPEALKAIVELSGCDMRKALNTLQSVSMAASSVTVDAVYQTTGKPPPRVISQLLDIALNSPFEKAVNGLLFVCVCV